MASNPQDTLQLTLKPASDPVDSVTNPKLAEIAPAVPELPCKCEGQGKGRKLIVCIDGTSNRFGENNSNVVEFYSHIDKSPSSNQLTYYNSGIGTYVEPSLTRLYPFFKQWLDNHIDLAIAWNFKNIVLAAYRWLSDNYRAGDTIYLFGKCQWTSSRWQNLTREIRLGFSRGAYQVRTLAAMIETVGLIFAGNQEQIPFAYQLYADQQKSWWGRFFDRLHLRLFGTDLRAQRKSLARTFKNTFSMQNVRVHFVGAWDTVSSIGVFRGNLLQLTQTTNHICFFRHALALDERRVKFLAEYATAPDSAVAQGTGGLDGTEGTTFHFDDPVHGHQIRQSPRVKEVWFPGSHSDIGGGNRANPDLGLRRPSLLWVRYEAMLAGLSVRELGGKSNWQESAMETIETTNSLGLFWWLLEILPFLNWKSDSDSTAFIWRPHLGKGRTILPHQKIHISVHKTKQGYVPSATFKSRAYNETWEELLKNNGKNGTPFHRWLEQLEKQRGGLVDLVETAFHDETTIWPLVSQLGKDRDNEVLGTLLYIAKHHRQAILRERNIIPKLCGPPSSETRDSLLSMLAEEPEDLGGELSYKDAVRNSQLDENAKKRVRDVHLAMIRGDSFLCGAKGISGLACHDDVELKDAVGFLVDRLQGDEQKDWDAAADALSNLARHDDSRQEIRDRKLIPLAIEWLRSNDSTKIPRGATVLSALVKQAELWTWVEEENKLTEFLIDGFMGDIVSVRREFGRVIQSIPMHQEGLEAILKTEVISSVTPLLKSEDPNKIDRGANAIVAFADHEKLRSMILDAHPILSLIKGLGCDSEVAQRQCANALCILAKHEDGQHAMINGQVIRSLINLLQSNDAKNILGGALGLSQIAGQERLRAMIRDADPIPLLATGLASDSEPAQVACTIVLNHIAKHEDGQQALIDAQVMPLLINFLKSADSGSIFGGATGISFLAEHEKLRAMILDADPIPCLAAGLSSGSESIRKTCRQALKNLVKYEDGRQGVLHSRILPSLSDSLQSDDPEKILQGANWVCSLADQDDLRAGILGGDPIGSLVAGLGSDAESARDSCRWALENLLKYENGRQAVLKAQIVTSIGDWLKSDDIRKILRGANVILALAVSVELRAEILGNEPIPSLIAGLVSESDSVRNTCTWALVDLAKYKNGRLAILHAEIIPSLADSLKSDQPDRIVQGADGIYALAGQDELREVILGTDPIPSLIASLGSDVQLVRESCRWTLQNLVRHKNGQQAMLHVQSTASVTEWLKSDDPTQVLRGANGIRALADQDELRSDILSDDPIPPLVAGLGSDSDSVSNTCTWALTSLVTYRDGRQEVLKAQIIPSIRDWLKSADPAQILRGANAIRALAAQAEPRAEILDNDPIPSLVAGLCSESDSIRNPCSWALEDLVKYKNGRLAVLHAKIIPLLADLLKSDDPRKIVQGAEGIYALVGQDELRGVILSTDAIPSLVAGLGSDLKLARDSCRWTLENLVRHKNGRQEMLHAQSIVSVTEWLKSDDPTQILRGSTEIRALAGQDEIRTKILSDDPIPSLVAGLGNDLELVRDNCRWTLEVLIKYRDGRLPILHRQIVPSLVKWLKNDDPNKIVQGANMISSMAGQNELRAVVLGTDPIPPLVDGLGSDSDSVRNICTWALASLVAYEDGRQAVFLAQKIALVVDWLKSTKPSQILRGANVIRALADQAELRSEILSNDPIPALVAGVGNDSTLVRDSCRWALENLVKHKNGQMEILRTQIIPSLTNWLKSENPTEILRGANGIRALTIPDELRAEILGTDPIPSLVVGLGSDLEPVRDDCRWAMETLVRYKDARQSILHAQIIPSVTELLKSDDTTQVLRGANEIRALAGQNELRTRILSDDPITPLVAGLGSDSDSVRDTCTGALVGLVIYWDGRRGVQKAQIIPSIRDLLKSTEPARVLRGANIIRVLAGQTEPRAEILGTDPTPSLVAGLSSESDSVRNSCSWALENLVQYKDGRLAILRAEIITALADSLKSDDPVKIVQGAEGIYALADQDELRLNILDTDPFPSLVAGLSKSLDLVRNTCTWTLQKLVKHKNGRLAILHAGIIPSLAEFLKSDNPNKIIHGAQGIYALVGHEELRTGILNTDAISSLVASLGNDLELVRVHCRWALQNLAGYENGRQAILRGQTIPSIGAWLTSSDPANILRGATVIRALVAQDTLRPSILSELPIAAPVVGLSSRTESIQTAYCWMLHAMAQHDDSRQQILDVQAIVSVMELLKSKDPRAIAGGAMGIFALADIEIFRTTILDTSPLPYLEAGLSSHLKYTRDECSDALDTLSKYDDGWEAILNAKIILSFTDALKSQALADISRGSNGIYTLAKHDKLRAAILKENPTSYLVAGLSCASDSVQIECGRALRELAEYDDGKQAILQADVVTRLVELFDYEDVHKRTAGARGLYILAGFDKLSAAIKKTNAIQQLRGLINDNNEASTYAGLAVDCLTHEKGA